MKICFKCKVPQPLDNFYKHSQMADGHLNKCKSCSKKDTKKNRLKNVDYYRLYDKNRGCRVSQKYNKEYKKRYPNKYRAHTIVNNAIRDKKLFSQACEVCGSKKTHAHHDDYLKPLNVRWLCAIHHREWHDRNGQGENP